MIANYILILIELIKISYQLSIESIFPLNIKVNKEKEKIVTMAIIFDENIDMGIRNNSQIKLEIPSFNITIYSSKKEQDSYDERKIEFILNTKNFSDHYGNYSLIYDPDKKNITYNQTILIYENDIILKNPKNKYELTEDSPNAKTEKTIKYEFQYQIIPQEINKILYFKESDQNNKSTLEKYTVEEGTKLKITFPGQTNVDTYVFDIYPEYDKDNENPGIRFYLHFHNFLLRNEAIYIKKDSVNLIPVSFITLLKKDVNSNPFIITEESSNQEIDCENFDCYKEYNTAHYLCECSLNFRLKTSPSIIKIVYEEVQSRELYLILYDSTMDLCYVKGDPKNLQIEMEWNKEMEYDHELYFNETIPKYLDRTKMETSNEAIIKYKYYTSLIYLSTGVFGLRSSIPSLNYTDYNLVDDKNLYIYIYPNNGKLTNKVDSYIFSHNNSEQIVNLIFDDPSGATVLDTITLSQDNKINITVSKSGGECKPKDNNNFVCYLKSIIFNYDSSKNGNYSIIYKTNCEREYYIEGGHVILDKGISLVSISPSWIKKSEVNGSELILEYNDNVEESTKIYLYTTDKYNLSGPYIPKLIENKIVKITLGNLEKGLYHIYTEFNNNKSRLYEENLSFKVSEQIQFEFNHHYFVINNNDDKGKNNLKIRVMDDNIDDFGCIIIENINQYNLTSNDCKNFEYPISKVGIIKFSYYDKQRFIIPIDDNITVVQSYTQLFKFNSLRDCYYYHFDLSYDIVDSFKNKLSLALFLRNSDNQNVSFIFDKENNKYSLDDKNVSFDKDYFLFASENGIDEEVFLYKYNIKFTNITVRPFIIEPDTTIIFSDIKCDLSKSKFVMKKYEGSLIEKSISNCKYNNNSKQLSCNIIGIFYSTNIYKNYYYQIDDKNISSINDLKNVYLTFVSKKLNEASFKINKTKNNITEFTINIINTDKDFYFPLLQNLTYILYNGTNNTKAAKREDNNFIVKDDEGTIQLNIEIKINQILYINYLTRGKEEWESISDKSTLFHHFNDYIDNQLFEIEPKIYAYHSITSEKEFPITIQFYDTTYNNYIQYINLPNCSKPENMKTNIRCMDKSKLNSKAQNFSVSIKNDDGIDASRTIKFIYYKLNDAKDCLNNLENVMINIYAPDDQLRDRIKLDGYIKSFKTISPNGQIVFTLNSTDNNDQYSPLEMVIENENNFREQFTLKELGINLIPKYNIGLDNNEKTIYLLPGNNQYITVYLSVEGNVEIDKKHIKEFSIKHENEQPYVLKKEEKSDNSFILIFNNTIDSKKDYILCYTDKCDNTVETNIKVSFYTFTINRFYYVLNNNLDMDKQNLTIEGPNTHSISINVYKNNNSYDIMNYDPNLKHYYIVLDKASKGDYSFIISFNGENIPINGIVYVRDYLKEFFTIENEPLNCLYLVQERKELKSLNYSITSNFDKINNINIFKSQFTSDKQSFYNFSIIPNQNKKKETFVFNYSENTIIDNKEYYIYLTENNYHDQPLYVYKYKYTNLSLHNTYSNLIYTDADYILFNMNCKISDIQPFYLQNSKNKKYKIQCEDGDNYYNEKNNIYTCKLSDKDKEKNELLKFGNEIFDYGNYDIIYNEYKITDHQFFLSNEIENIEFIVEQKEDIYQGHNNTFTIKMGNKTFFSPETESVKYRKKSSTRLLPTSFKPVFVNNGNIDSYLNCIIFIEKNEYYYIKQICRHPCIYCRKSNCASVKDYEISSTTPDVTFSFDKHYIAIKNSFYKENNNNKKNNIIEIKKEGETDKVKYIIYTRKHKDLIEKKNISCAEGRKLYEINDLQVGRYTFEYCTNANKIFTILNEVVLVVNYDYELFNYSELMKNCLYYEIDRGILVSITKNTTYLYKDDVVESKMAIYLDNFQFPYDKNDGYKILSENKVKFNNNYKGYPYTLQLKEIDADDNFFFTEMQKEITITSFNLNTTEFFYKDNIVFENIYCKLDNIYIKSKSNQNEPYSLLDCEDINQGKSYCDAKHYSFKSKKKDYFDIYIGNKREEEETSEYFKTHFTPIIYNSIKDSIFSLNYDEPTIYITSSNFNLSKIEQIKIDNNIIQKKKFSINSDDLITYIFYKNNSNVNYLTELMRVIHRFDRPTTIKINNPNLIIQKTECQDFFVSYNGECLSCLQIAVKPGKDGTKIWYQNGTCVDKCSNEEGYYIYNSLYFYCLKCSKDLINENICGCYNGTVKSDLDDQCYLPEDDEIKKLLLIRPNAQCYRPDGKTFNYCSNNADKCEIKSYSGYSFPYCICKSGYNGKYCEFKDDDKPDLEENMKNIKNKIQKNKINETDVYLISKIRSTTFYLGKDYTNKYISKISKEQINLYINATVNTIKEIKDKDLKVYNTIYDVIELAIYYLYYEIKQNNKKIRNLQAEDNLNFLLDIAHFLNYKSNKDIQYNYNIQTDSLNLISFICYKKNRIDSSFKSFLKNTTKSSNITGYINLTANNNEDELILLTLFNNKLFFYEDQENGIIFKFSTNNNTTNLNNLKDFHTYVYSSDFNVNYELANYYQINNISIYNKYDTCFTEPCYFNKNFKFDLTQKYRKKYIFQKYSIENSLCRYNSFEFDSNHIDLNCDKFENFSDNSDIKYAVLTITMKEEKFKDPIKVYNLPMRCPKKIDTLEENIAFWTYLIMCCLEIVYIIGINILTLGSLRKVSIRKGLVNDGIYYKIMRIPDSVENDKNSNDESIKKSTYKLKEKDIRKQQQFYQTSIIDYNNDVEIHFNKSLLEYFLQNFKELHPLSSLCRVSIISPLILHSWFFIFNILSLFGFNALIYYEGLIEKRIYDKTRNYFDYPMRKEFHKIILSILCQIALTALLKLIVLVSLKQRDSLEESLKQCKLKGREELNNEIIARIDQFENEMLTRRLIGGSLMLIIVVFFFYYTVVFCGIYIKTQKNWIYGCVWSLFWNWVVFAPIYIIIISFLEHKKQDSNNALVYNLKRLFFF